MSNEPPRYYDLHIETFHMPRTSFLNLPLRYSITCTKLGGWELWESIGHPRERVVAGEFSLNGLRLDVGGHVIVDSLTFPAMLRETIE